MIRIAPLLRNSFVPNRRNRVRDYRLTRLRGNAINRCQFLRRLINRRNKKKRIKPGRNCIIYILYLFLSIIRKILFLILILVNMSHVCLFSPSKMAYAFFMAEEEVCTRGNFFILFLLQKLKLLHPNLMRKFHPFTTMEARLFIEPSYSEVSDGCHEIT